MITIFHLGRNENEKKKHFNNIYFNLYKIKYQISSITSEFR